MKKVLIIVYTSPGASRIEGLVRYLPEFNWETVILTATTSKYTNLPTRIAEIPDQDTFGLLRHLIKFEPEKDIRQQIKKRFGIISNNSFVDPFLTLGSEIVYYPYPEKKWKHSALKAAREILQREKIDAVISSAPPVVSHDICSELKVEQKVPWIADLRDLWSQNHNYGYSSIRRLFDRKFELKILTSADALVTVSQPWAEKLKMLHIGKPVHTIPHGYHPAKVEELPVRLTAKFTITYTGSIYAGKQDPAKLFVALQDLISDRTVNPDDIQVRFYGNKLVWLEKEIEQHKLSSVVKQHGLVSKQSAIEKQRESQLLLLLDWDNPKEYGVTTAKFLEYLGARRPILATGGVVNNVVDILLDETKAGIHTLAVEDIKTTLRELYQEYKLKGKAIYKGEESKVNKYTHREMARKFAEILDGVI